MDIDEVIIASYEMRNEKAIEDTRTKYGGYMKRIAQNILPVKEDAEECVSDSLMKIWNAIPPARPENLKAFAGRVTRNTALDYAEKNAAQKRGSAEIAAALDELSEIVGSSENDPQAAAEGKELVAAINQVLGSLTPQSRKVFVLRYFYFCSIYEIAEEMMMTKGSVSASLSRSRKELKDRLVKEGLI